MGGGGHVPPPAVRLACRFGLVLVAEGCAGRGLTDAARELAWRMARGEPITGAEVTTLVCYFGRFVRNRRFMKSVRERAAGAASVSWHLRGGDAGRAWVEEIAFWERPLPRRDQR